MPFDPAGTGLLSDEAAGLDPDVLGAQTEVAAAVLGIAGIEYAGWALNRANLAVALQINTQVATGGTEHLQSKSRGQRSETYAKRADGTSVAINPNAKRIADQLLGRRPAGTVIGPTRPTW